MTISFFSEHYINPLTVFGINRIFNTESNKELLIDFLNAIIGLSGKNRICDLQFLKTEQLDTMEMGRNSVFDVYCKTACNKSVIIEMQKDPAIFFWDRKLFYSAFPIRDEILTRKKWNLKLDAVYAIGLLCFSFFDGQENNECYLHKVPLKNTEAQAIHDKLTFVFAELPKFKKKESELKTQLDKWLYAINHLCELDKPSPALSGKMFDKLFYEAAVASLTTMEANAYFESQKQYLYYINSIDFAEMRGEHIGKHIGIKIGFEQGFEEGRNSERDKFIQAMKEQGYSDEAITMILQATQDIKDRT